MRLLLLITTIGLILRVIAISIIPTGFTPDEAAFGYNAFTLLKTGKDEWGRPFFQLPAYGLRSFGDDKLPAYAFFVVPSVKLLGLNEGSTRLPNAILGGLGVIVMYIISQSAFGRRNKNIGLISAAVYALSPWSIQLSRGAFEANLAVTLLPLTLACMIRKKIIFAGVMGGISMYTYHTPRLVTFPSMLITNFFFANKKSLLSLVIAGVLFFPGLIGMITSGNSRVSNVSIFSPTDNWLSVADRRFESNAQGISDNISRIFSNKLTSVSQEFVNNYLSYFSPQFLVTKGPAESTYGMLTNQGVIYLIDGVALLIWIYFFIKKPTLKQIWLLILILIYPVAAALAKGPGLAANRAALLMPVLIIGISIGYSNLSKSLPSKILKAAIIFGYLVLFAFFLENYSLHSYKQLAKPMLYGYREVFLRALPISKNYESVLISKSLSEPHIYVAFFTQYEPKKYQEASIAWKDFNLKGYSFLDQMDGYKLGRYTFGSINKANESGRTLIIARPNEIPSQDSSYFIVNFPDGTPSVVVTDNE